MTATITLYQDPMRKSLSNGQFTIEHTEVDRDELYWSGVQATTLREAFEISINKWQCIVNNPSLGSGGIATCGLCHMYVNSECQNCPIAKKTGATYCEQTPINFRPIYASKQDMAADEVTFLTTLAQEHGFTIAYIKNEERNADER